MKIKNYKHIIWDWNGTIFNDVDLSINIINRILTEKGLNRISIKDYKEMFTIPVQKYYEKLGFDFTRESFEIIGKNWIEEYEQRKFECKLYEGIDEIFNEILLAGIKQSILSAYSQHTLEEMINHFNLRKYFEYVVGLDNIYATGKLYLGKELIKKLGNGKGETLMIGDTLHDYEVAKEIGADCILVSDGHQSKSILINSGTVVLNNIQELYYLF